MGKVTNLRKVVHFLDCLIVMIGKTIACLRLGINENDQEHLVGLSEFACTFWARVEDLKRSLHQLGGDKFLQVVQRNALEVCGLNSPNLESAKERNFCFVHRGGRFEGTIKECSVSNPGDFFEQKLLLFPRESFLFGKQHFAVHIEWTCRNPEWRIHYGDIINEPGVLRITNKV